MQALYEQLTAYYDTMRRVEENNHFTTVRDRIYDAMEEYRKNHPNASAVAFKSELHSQIAKWFEPVIFDELPFYYEMGVRPAENWGGAEKGIPSAWGISAFPLPTNITDPDIIAFDSFACGNIFDGDHHCPGYTRLFQMGIGGILQQIQEEKAVSNAGKSEFLLAAEKSCNAILSIAEKFAQAAEKQLSVCEDPAKCRNLSRIAATARKIPKNPPADFYEGLCMLWFMREVLASIEGVGISVLGHLDKLLGTLYDKDVREGKITREEAKDLLKRWMAPTHIKFNARGSIWADSSSCIELGGCDQNGDPIFNEVTCLVIEAHEELCYTIPKINCRISENSPKAYIDRLSQSILKGHNVYALFNDTAIIKGLMANGKSLKDARNYVNGGCQETIVEGKEHSAGVYLYFNMPKVMDISVNGICENERSMPTESTLPYYPRQITQAETFEEFYLLFLENIKAAATGAAVFRTKHGKNWRNVNPCPGFSATLSGCIENGADYTAGGAAYNRSTFCATGLATVVDSLYAIKKLVYDEKAVSLQELCQASRSNWESNPKLREKCVALAKYGHGNPEVDQLAAWLVQDLNTHIIGIENERGEHFQLSMFAYNYYNDARFFVGATPDGRYKGDYLSQGVSPGRLRSPGSVLDAITSVSATDYTKTGGINVLDINLPYHADMTPDIVTAIIRAFTDGSGHAIQMNYVSREELLDAQINPEKHRDIIVRMCGFSAYFVNLTKHSQEEFLTRNFHTS